MATWNFHESGHGKGAPDGVGGTLKRTANRKVLHGRDIKDAISFKETLEEEKLNISVFHVPTDMVEEKRKLLPSLKSIPGTMKFTRLSQTNLERLPIDLLAVHAMTHPLILATI